MGEACDDRVKTIKTIFFTEKFKFFSKEVFAGERFKIKGLFYTNYKMAISVQNPMLKVSFLKERGHLQHGVCSEIAVL